MSTLDTLKPRNKPRVMDLIEAAGIDVSDWENFKGGKRKASTNPKYCYSWSFSESDKVVVLNIWHKYLKEKKGVVQHSRNYRKTETNPIAKPVWKKRAKEMDAHIQLAYENNLPVRVIICDGKPRKNDDTAATAAVVSARMLDPVPWTVTAYNKRNGEALLTRGTDSVQSTNLRVLFSRIGYMKYYTGSQADDEKPVGGGKYNETNTGHEIYNFKDVEGSVFGYIQPYLKKKNITHSTINLEKIEPGFTGDSIDNVLVIFFSTLPGEGGQVIVGWYQHATVYRNYQKASNKLQRNNYSYNLEAQTYNCTLLPPYSREHQIAGKGLPKAGRPGQANAFYITEGKKLKSDEWIQDAIEYVSQYDGENLLDEGTVDIEIQRAGVQVAENERARAKGQAFNSSVKARKAIENHSMKKARKYFEKELDYTFLRDTSSNYSYDLEFEKNGKKLYVEVKGTQSDGKSVFLTRNEVLHTNKNKNNCAIYILHSIKLKETKAQCTCKGGKEHVILPWTISVNDLQVITYQYNVPGNDNL